jgi:hypothetical protein
LRDRVTVFAIRHLSPACAFHLCQLLDEIHPTAVLVEGPSDANSQLSYITSAQTRLPIAVLAYTAEFPIRTILYPLAVYSPEYQALLWSQKNGVQAEFIDLPSQNSLALAYASEKKDDQKLSVSETNIYQKWADLAGEPDHETYWERHFEYNPDRNSFLGSVYEFGQGLRQLMVGSRREFALNLVREAFMRQKIDQAITRGHQPEKIVVITGAYHAGALKEGPADLPADGLAKLPAVKTRLTLMPYSYFKLSLQSGYGAGNIAPQYFEMLWDYLGRNKVDSLAMDYLTRIAQDLREHGTCRSTAHVIESMRLAQALAGLHQGIFPALKDLEDAAVSCIGEGELSTVAEAVARINVGTKIGNLAEGVSQTSLQNDFNEQIKQLKLEKYKSNVAQDLELDLRENRRVKSQEAAFLDLKRSVFCHRLRILNIEFAQFHAVRQDAATWKELWTLQWTPEIEIALVETTLLGETIELALAYRFHQRLADCVKINEAAGLVRDACICNIMASMEQACIMMQRLAVDAGVFNDVADAAFQLSTVIDYKDIRNFDTGSLVPLLQQLFLRGSLLLLDAANCDQNAANEMLVAIDKMNRTALKHHQFIDEALWIQKLQALSNRDDRNARLSGFACAILLERNLISSEQLASEVSRRLSPGIEPDLGAGWFEGLALRNRYALLSRLDLWRELANYIDSLDEEAFKRALVFLRRSFGYFSPNEKVSICENLGEIWKVDKNQVNEILSGELNAEEKKKVQELDNFDFGDI